MLRQFAILKQDVEPKTKHFIGFPPEISGDSSSVRSLPNAKFVLLIEGSDGFSLYRYDVDGNFAGDTFHGTIPNAKGQAKFEYNIKSESQWISIPKDEKSEINYVIRYYKAREQRRAQKKERDENNIIDN